MNETQSLNWKRNEQLSTLAVGEAIASNASLNTKVRRTGIKENRERINAFSKRSNNEDF